MNENTPIARAAAIMAYERIHRVIVMNRERKVVGIVSALDVLAWLARYAGLTVP